MTITKFISRLDLSEARVDRSNNIIKGVRLCSIGEARGHNKFVDQRTLEQVRDCAKKYKTGLRVRFNPSTFAHGDAGLAGVIPSDSIRVEGDATIVDLRVYKSFPHREYLFEIAETAPDNFGLSLEFSGLTERLGEKEYARCDEIFAATVVDLPAANPTGLFAAGDGDNKKPYGDVEYADPGYQEDGQHRYPIDSEDHIRAAWSYINQSDNAAKYSSENLTKIKDRIKSAAKKHGIEISEEQQAMNKDEIIKLIQDTLRETLPSLMKTELQTFRAQTDGEITAEEIKAAGCTDDMTDEQKKARVIEWRAKDGNKPVTQRDLQALEQRLHHRPLAGARGAGHDEDAGATG